MEADVGLVIVSAMVGFVIAIFSVIGTAYLWRNAGLGDRLGIIVVWLLTPFIMMPFTMLFGIGCLFPPAGANARRATARSADTTVPEASRSEAIPQ